MLARISDYSCDACEASAAQHVAVDIEVYNGTKKRRVQKQFWLCPACSERLLENARGRLLEVIMTEAAPEPGKGYVLKR